MKTQKLIILLTLIVFIVNPLIGNAIDDSKNSVLYFNPGIGYNYPVSSMNLGEITDYLIDYTDHSMYWRLISGTYFLPSNLGIKFSFIGNSSFSKNDRAINFENEIKEKYSDDFTLSSVSSIRDKRYTFLGGTFQKIELGLAYKIEFPKYIIIPGISTGVILYDRNIGVIIGEHKYNEDINLRLLYGPSEKSGLMYLLSPSVTFAYRLSSKYLFSIDMAYSYSKYSFGYTERQSVYNQNFDSDSFYNMHYKNDLHSLSLGMGLILEIRNNSDLN